MQNILAGLGLFVCLLLLVRMFLRPPARERLDRFGRSLRSRLMVLFARAAQLARRTRRPAPPSARPDPKAARQMAEEVIRRARNGASGAPDGEWEGNVFRPRGVDWSGPPGGRPADPTHDSADDPTDDRSRGKRRD